jgi:hypothetical protein
MGHICEVSLEAIVILFLSVVSGSKHKSVYAAFTFLFYLFTKRIVIFSVREDTSSYQISLTIYFDKMDLRENSCDIRIKIEIFLIRCYAFKQTSRLDLSSKPSDNFCESPEVGIRI